MGKLFDDFAKGMASGMPRRRLLKRMVAGAAALAGLAAAPAAQAQIPYKHEVYWKNVNFVPPVNFTLPPVNFTLPPVNFVPPFINHVLPPLNYTFPTTDSPSS